MNVPHLVVELNNKAIHSLANGDTDGSVATISNALSSLQLCHNLQSSASTAQPNTLSSLVMKLLQTINPDDNKINRTRMASIELDYSGPADCSSSFSIFNHVLTIPNADELDCDLTKNYARLQCMLCYNLGLTVHMQAMRTGRAEELRGALSLYEYGFSVVENSWHLMDQEDIMLLLLALLNNLGHCHANLYNCEQTKSCVDWLKLLVAHPAFLSILQRPQYTSFSMNLLVVLKQFNLQNCSPAA